jgi:hypothetical protein
MKMGDRSSQPPLTAGIASRVDVVHPVFEESQKDRHHRTLCLGFWPENLIPVKSCPRYDAVSEASRMRNHEAIAASPGTERITYTNGRLQAMLEVIRTNDGGSPKQFGT